MAATANDQSSKTETTDQTTVKDTVIAKCDAKEPESSITDDNKTENEKEYLEAGRKLINEQNYSEAVPILSSALQIIQEKNIATSIESVPYYMLYGEALLRLVQSSNDLFAAPVRESQQQHQQLDAVDEDEEEQEDDDMVDDAVQPVVDGTADNNENDKTETEAEAEKAVNPKDEQDDDENEDDDVAQQDQEEPEQEAGGFAEGDVDTTEDREIAWETFEYARSIIEEFLSSPENAKNDEYLKLLASCHSFLGELLIEDENNEMALEEFCEALKVQDRCSTDSVKCRPRAFNHFMACLAAQFCGKDDDALEHCKVALAGLSERMCCLLKSMQCSEELKEDEEYAQIVKVSEALIASMDDTQKESEDGKELQDLVGIMSDMIDKLDEVQDTLQRKKERADAGEDEEGDENKNGNAMSLLNAADPLQALINGLTSRFGIDEEELAAMAQEEEEQNDKENVDETEKDAESAGVTTIGFGNAKVDDDEPVNELGSFGHKAQTERKSGKKRSLEDAEIETTEDDAVNAKKMKLNSGDAAVVEEK